MPEMIIRLRCDPTTGKRDIVVSLRGDEDALPHEHEQMHRTLVDKLIQGGALKAHEIGKLVIERDSGPGEAAPVDAELPRERSARPQGQ